MTLRAKRRPRFGDGFNKRKFLSSFTFCRPRVIVLEATPTSSQPHLININILGSVIFTTQPKNYIIMTYLPVGPYISWHRGQMFHQTLEIVFFFFPKVTEVEFLSPGQEKKSFSVTGIRWMESESKILTTISVHLVSRSGRRHVPRRRVGCHPTWKPVSALAVLNTPVSLTVPSVSSQESRVDGWWCESID